MSAASATVGTNLRRLRLARGLSLVELGRLSGLAKGTLTQLEAGRANPTIETLEALASGLGAELSDLVLPPPLSTPEVVRADAGQITPGRVLEARLVNRTDTGSTIVELFELRLSPGPAHRAQSHAAGVVEQLFVLGGSVVVGPEGEEVLLRPRDFVRFPADRPHSYAAPDGEAHALMWQLLPTLPAVATTIENEQAAVTSVEGLVPRGPGGVGPAGAPPPRTLPRPPVRGSRPASRTGPGPRTDPPRPPGRGS